MNHVYHFTDTVRLPWIIDSGELQIGRNQTGNYPNDFLWATVDGRGDRSATMMASAKAAAGYRAGRLAIVRLTLDASDFERWPDILVRYPLWTPAHVHRLESTATGSDPANWRVRDAVLPLSRVLHAEAKTYNNNAWRLIELRVLGERPWLGVQLNGRKFFSRQTIVPGVPTMYEIGES